MWILQIRSKWSPHCTDSCTALPLWCFCYICHICPSTHKFLTPPWQQCGHKAAEHWGTQAMFLAHCMRHYSTSLAAPQITLHHVKHPEIEIMLHDTRHLLRNVMWLLKFHQKIFSWSIDYYQIRLELINPNWIWHREHESKTRTILCMHYIHNPVLNIIMLSWRWGFSCWKLAGLCS